MYTVESLKNIYTLLKNLNSNKMRKVNLKVGCNNVYFGDCIMIEKEIRNYGCLLPELVWI